MAIHVKTNVRAVNRQLCTVSKQMKKQMTLSMYLSVHSTHLFIVYLSIQPWSMYGYVLFTMTK